MASSPQPPTAEPTADPADPHPIAAPEVHMPQTIEALARLVNALQESIDSYTALAETLASRIEALERATGTVHGATFPWRDAGPGPGRPPEPPLVDDQGVVVGFYVTPRGAIGYGPLPADALGIAAEAAHRLMQARLDDARGRMGP